MCPRASQSQLLSPQAAATDARVPGARAPKGEKPAHHNWKGAPLLATRESPPEATKTQHSHRERNRAVCTCKKFFNNKAIYEFRFLEIIGIVIEITEEMPWESFRSSLL